MDKQFLIRVLHSSPRVVLPKFGAFLRKQQEGYVVFTPFLKSDDGFLVDEIQKEYGVASSDAEEMIEAFVAHVKEVLQSAGRFYIDGVGSLVIDTNGAISFVMDASRQIPPSASSVASTPDVVAEPKPVVPKAQPVEQEPIVTQAPPVAKPVEVEPVIAQPVTPRPEPISPPPPVQPIAPQPINANRGAFTPPPAQTSPRPAPQPLKTPPPRSQSQSMPRPQPARPSAMAQNPNAAQNFGQRPPQPLSQNPGQNPPQQGQPANSGQRPPQQQGQAPQRRPHPARGEQQPPRRERPLPKSPPSPRKKGKNDMWLIIAIIAAVLAIGLLVFGFITSSAVNELQL